MLALVVSSFSLLLPGMALPGMDVARRGASATPDYGAVASQMASTAAVESWVGAELPALGKRTEGGLRKMRAAYSSAPDYRQIARAALQDAIERPAVVAEKAESGIRKMRAAYSSAPDYAKISGAVAAAGVALAYTQGIDAIGMTAGHGFAGPLAVEPDTVRLAAGPSLWKATKVSASPQYGQIAAAVAAIGHAQSSDQSMRNAGLSQ